MKWKVDHVDRLIMEIKMQYNKDARLKPQTVAVHGGEKPDAATGASSPNIVMSSTFVAEADASFSSENFGDDTPFFYSRWGNPTVDQLERKIAALEGGETAIGFASGMAAISAVFFHNLSAGDHLVIGDVVYAAAAEMSADLLPRMGVRVTRVNTSDLDALRAAVTPGTKLVYLESPCNPILRLTDIAAATDIAHAAGAKVALDSTFATPMATQPISLGVDFVVHSLTKYIGGHGDAIGGVVVGAALELAPMRKLIAIRTGGILSPFNAWLIMRGAATLPLRMRAHEENAFAVARALEAHPKVARVIYPGLESHPQHELAKRQMRNFSGMLTFRVHGDGPAAAKVLAERLRVIHNAVSLGHHRSLIFYLPTADMLTTSFHLDAAQEASYREYAGDGIFRLSVGIEDGDDLVNDLDQALAGI
ncbi:MAG TPA: aminotransferase class I/II-fold pyridoxal phosphate-dependent enzyme [Capsulimonadaceae bacterium]|jgi:methionine-gamma-lyase